MKGLKFIIAGFLLVSNLDKLFSQDTIHWRFDYNLKWEDFKGKPDTSSQFGATSYCAIKYSLAIKNGIYSYNVFCFFNRPTSWTKDSDSLDLVHEQGHFDVAELFARKL